MEERFKLPPEIELDAGVRGNEYWWTIDQFPSALSNAKRLGFACMGGQFQFRFPDGTYEMCWLRADPEARKFELSARSFVESSCNEVLERFKKRVAETDFISEGGEYVQEQLRRGNEPLEYLAFVGYFEKVVW
jgi:hypothetical protein